MKSTLSILDKGQRRRMEEKPETQKPQSPTFLLLKGKRRTITLSENDEGCEQPPGKVRREPSFSTSNPTLAPRHATVDLGSKMKLLAKEEF